jgi:hypothetical protein
MEPTGEPENHGCEGGTLLSAFTYATEYYVFLEQDYPYKGYDQKCIQDAIPTKKTKTKFQSFTTVNPYSPIEIIDLLRNGTVAASISATSPIFKFYAKGIIDDIHLTGDHHMDCYTGSTNHAVTIVGFGKDNTFDR